MLLMITSIGVSDHFIHIQSIYITERKSLNSFAEARKHCTSQAKCQNDDDNLGELSQYDSRT